MVESLEKGLVRGCVEWCDIQDEALVLFTHDDTSIAVYACDLDNQELLASACKEDFTSEAGWRSLGYFEGVKAADVPLLG